MTPTPKRRWLRFSLRGMLLVTTAVAIWVGWNAKVVRERRAAVARLQQTGAYLFFRPERDWSAPSTPAADADWEKVPQISWVRRKFGDVAVTRIVFAPETPTAIMDAAKETFPEAATSKSDYLKFHPPAP